MRDAVIGAALGWLFIYLGSLIPYTILRWAVIGIGVLFVVVMTGFIGVLAWERIGPYVGQFFSRARGHVRHDPQLGKLRRDAKARCWEATLPFGDRTVEVLIDGTDAPDPQLLKRARDLRSNIGALGRQVEAYLAREADQLQPHDAEMAAEIRTLRMSAVQLSFPDRPNEATIVFDLTDDERYWTCVWANGELQDLDYD